MNLQQKQQSGIFFSLLEGSPWYHHVPPTGLVPGWYAGMEVVPAPFLGTKLSQGVRGGGPSTQKGGVVSSLHLSTSDGEKYFWDLIPWTGTSTFHNRDLKHWYLWSQAHTADGDCSHEIQRHLLLGRKAMSNLDCVLKHRDITLSTQICLVKASFPSSHVWMWELDHKEGWVPKNWCFWTVVLERTLKSLGLPD